MQITAIDDKTVSLLEVRDGQNWRRTYENSASGRSELSAEYPAVFAEIAGVGKPWGEEPTITSVAFTIPTVPSVEERLNDLAKVVEAMLGVEA